MEESQQLQVCRLLLNAGYTVYIEPCDLIPDYVRDDLVDRGAVFATRESLIAARTDFFEIPT